MKYNKFLFVLLLTPVLFSPSLVDAKEYLLSDGTVFEGTSDEYKIAEQIIEEHFLPWDDLRNKAFETTSSKKKYRIFNINNIIKNAEYTGNAGYDKKITFFT